MHAVSRFVAVTAFAVAASAAFAQGHKVQSTPTVRPTPSTAGAVPVTNTTPPTLNPTTSTLNTPPAVNPTAANTTSFGGTAGTGTTGTTVVTTTGNGFTVPTDTVVDVGSAAAATRVLGGAGSTVRGPSQDGNSGAGGYNAIDLARSFYMADANHDGELTRAEFSRLSIAPLSFEEMDRNFDGVISRFEFEDATATR